MAGGERKEVEEEDEEDEEEEDEEEEEEDEEEEEEEQTAKVVAQSIRKGEEEDDDEFDFRRQQQQSAQQPRQQPPAPQQAKQPPAPQARQQVPVQQQAVQQHAGKERKLANETHDEAFDLDDEEDVVTPRRAEAEAQYKQDLMSKQLQNAIHDEAFDVDDERDVSTPPAGAGQKAGAPSGAKLANHHHDEAFDVGDDEEDVSSDEEAASAPARPAPMPQQTFTNTMQRAAARDQEEEESTSEEEEEEGGPRPPAPKGNEYNPQEYQNLNVSKDVRDLFQFITQYKPHTIDLETKLKPFIPDYIPAVGDIDTFIKIPRPDNKPDNLGLTVLDEPSATQSNPAVVKIGLSYGSKKKAPSVFVESIEDARNRPTLIDKWMTDIANLHKKKPAPTVHYTKHQPDVESLLQVWPAEFEDLLSSTIMLPPAKLNVELYQYVKFICCLLDIPVYNNLIESLHVLFTLYTEFKANQHFQNGPELNAD